MKIMTRMGAPVLNELQKSGGEFVRCIHSVGQPRPVLSKFFYTYQSTILKIASIEFINYDIVTTDLILRTNFS